jgi:hypothetical protein
MAVSADPIDAPLEPRRYLPGREHSVLDAGRRRRFGGREQDRPPLRILSVPPERFGHPSDALTSAESPRAIATSASPTTTSRSASTSSGASRPFTVVNGAPPRATPRLSRRTALVSQACHGSVSPNAGFGHGGRAGHEAGQRLDRPGPSRVVTYLARLALYGEKIGLRLLA